MHVGKGLMSARRIGWALLHVTDGGEVTWPPGDCTAECTTPLCVRGSHMIFGLHALKDPKVEKKIHTQQRITEPSDILVMFEDEKERK